MIVDRLKPIPFFSDFSTSDMEQASLLMKERTYDRSSFIFMEGNLGEEFYVVLSGSVEINRFENGKKFVLSTLTEGDIFGEMSLFDEGTTRSANAEVLEKSVLLVIKRHDLQNIMETNPKTIFRLVSVLIKRLRKTNDRIHEIAFLDVRSRIYKQILRLSEEYGVKFENTIMIDLRLTHQQIADMVGCTREMVSKVLAELQEAHIIGVNKKRIIIKNHLMLSAKVVSL